MAKLYFRYGAMGSSKTANALMVAYNYRERGKLPLLAKPKIENREDFYQTQGHMRYTFFAEMRASYNGYYPSFPSL